MTPSASSSRLNLAGSDRPRARWHPARKRLILGVLLVTVGSFLPWVYAVGIPKSGALGPGLWSFYGAMLGVAALMMPWRRISGGHAAVMAAICLGLPVWQLVHAINLVGFSGWMPGPGLVMVAFGGIIAAQCALRLFRDADDG